MYSMKYYNSRSFYSFSSQYFSFVHALILCEFFILFAILDGLHRFFMCVFFNVTSSLYWKVSNNLSITELALELVVGQPAGLLVADWSGEDASEFRRLWKWAQLGSLFALPILSMQNYILYVSKSVYLSSHSYDIERVEQFRETEIWR